MIARLAAALAAALSLAACAGARPVPACQLEFHFKAPERAHERLGEFNEMVRTIPPGGAHEALRGPACAMGADAVVVTRSMVVNLFDHTNVQGYALRWTPPPAPSSPPPAAGPAAPAPPPASPPAEQPAPETLKL
jgi:hypothetical protein